jgi:hypothetical protein
MQKRYQVFVSSTFKDLQDERQDTIKSIVNLRHIPSSMEAFPATDVDQLKYIKKIIDECDYYVLIVGARYGSVDKNGIGFTESEYDYALESGKTILAFVHGDIGAIPLAKADVDEDRTRKLNAFRERVMTGRMVREWTSRDQLQSAIIVSLTQAIADFPGVGWVRADATASDAAVQEILTLRKENERLDKELTTLRQALEPSVPDAADLNDTYKVRFTYDESRVAGTASIKWRDILAAVGPSLLTGTTSSQMVSALETYLEEKKLVTKPVSLLATDREQIRIQLMALRLVDLVSKRTSDGGEVNRLALTEKGRQELMNSLVIRKKISEANNESHP